MKQISDELEREGFHTQLAIVKSTYMTLFPKGRTVKRDTTTTTTLEAFYDDLCASPKYHDHSDRILYFLVDKLSLVQNEKEKQLLKLQADKQTGDMLESREMKFIELLIIGLSYETKETLAEAKILPKSAITSKEDAGDLISDLVRTGSLLPSTAKLNELLRCIKSGTYERQIKKVLNFPEWTATGSTLKTNTSVTKVKLSSESGDIVEADSPLAVSQKPKLGTQAHRSNWTAPLPSGRNQLHTSSCA